MRDFEKISFEQFKKDIKDDRELYDSYKLPERGTESAACYDLFLVSDITINPGEKIKIPTGIKAKFESDEALLFIVRSRMGFKYNIRLCNQVGVIDSDYYNNSENEGHMWTIIQNESDNKYTFKKGEALVQAMFIKYLVTDSDLKKSNRRTGNY